MASKKKSNNFPIIGIGASAGGLEAFEQFFRHAPIDSGMAFVLVPHLDPSHASLLTEILQRSTSMHVIEALDQIQVEPDKVYIIPPNRDMAVFHGTLQLTIPEQPHAQRMPIDAFLRSLAEDQQENAIGIILSGTGTDGTLGLRAILGEGGLALVQDPATAKFDGMPSSAIQAGYVTHVLPVEKMPETILAAASTFVPHIEIPALANSTSGVNHILMQLRTITGHDFSLYKKTTIGRRIERRMAQYAIEDLDVYVRLLKENPVEVRTLFKELLINVTSFFRDAEVFEMLQKDILPKLCKKKPDGSEFRIWIAGCSTGEEAYSIAILLRELMDETLQEYKVQIYSTDLDEDAIAIARAGIYPPNITQDVSSERLRRFFIKEDAGYRVKKVIREMVVFAIQDVIKDPPFTRLDLLSCRNLLIYLEPELQNRLIPAFHYALKPGGILLLSPSESIGHHLELFLTLDRKWKLYQAIHTIKSSRTLMAQGLSWVTENNDNNSQKTLDKPKKTNFTEYTRRLLVKHFAPASVLTDLNGEVLYVHGDTGKYLRPAQGQASLNVIEMARDGLELVMRNAVNQVAHEGKTTLQQQTQVKTNGGYTMTRLSVRPLPGSEGRQDLLLISFQDVDTPVSKPRKRKRVNKQAEQARIEELEHDLAYLKESYQANVEEQQASNEELKSTNEEMQSTNEELQSTNEELETSKEELQSVNEELVTVNSELQSKIEQLTSMQNDMKNLLDIISVGIIFLDLHLLIRSFTRETLRIYRLAPSDIGRPLADIRSVMEGDDLLASAQSVLDTLIPYEREINISSDDSWILVRIQPYRTLDNMIDGVVLTFTDITSRIKAVAVQEALLLSEGIVNTVHEPLIVLDESLKVVTASHSFYQEFKITQNDTEGHSIDTLSHDQWNIPDLLNRLKALVADDKIIEDYLIECNFSAIGLRKMRLNARRFIGRTRDPRLILLSIQVIK